MNVVNNFQAGHRIAAPVRDAVQMASARTGIDFDYLVDVARVEAEARPAQDLAVLGKDPTVTAEAKLAHRDQPEDRRGWTER